MKNTTDCSTCKHKQYPDGGHCYMFKNEPEFDCQVHTGNTAPRPRPSKALLTLLAAAVVSGNLGDLPSE